MNHLRSGFIAPKAKALETAVKINGVLFDGTKDITIESSGGGATLPPMDSTPTKDSSNLVTSGAVYKAINDAVSSIVDGDDKKY